MNLKRSQTLFCLREKYSVTRRILGIRMSSQVFANMHGGRMVPRKVFKGWRRHEVCETRAFPFRGKSKGEQEETGSLTLKRV